jgi:hypothetical protein
MLQSSRGPLNDFISVHNRRFRRRSVQRGEGLHRCSWLCDRRTRRGTAIEDGIVRVRVVNFQRRRRSRRKCGCWSHAGRRFVIHDWSILCRALRRQFAVGTSSCFVKRKVVGRHHFAAALTNGHFHDFGRLIRTDHPACSRFVASRELGERVIRRRYDYSD